LIPQGCTQYINIFLVKPVNMIHQYNLQSSETYSVDEIWLRRVKKKADESNVPWYFPFMITDRAMTHLCVHALPQLLNKCSSSD
jgi:hypothetical protein